MPAAWAKAAVAQCLTVCLAWAVAPAAGAAERWSMLAPPLFDRIGRGQGMDLGAVGDLAQDADGFIWASVSHGLARFDGYGFRLFRHDARDPGSLPGNDVECLHVDAGGHLWVGTSAGAVARYDPVGERFTSYPIQGGSTGARVIAIADDGSGGVWAATLDGGLDHIAADGTAGPHIEYRAGDPEGLPIDGVLALLLDRHGTLWIGGETGLARRDRGSQAFRRVPIAGADPNREIDVQELIEDSSGTIWLGTGHDGLGVVDADSGPAHIATGLPPGADHLADRPITAIAEAEPGVLWIATDQGIVILDTRAGRATRVRQDPVVPDSLDDNSVAAVLRSRDGLIWVGTRRGLSRHDPHVPVLTVPTGLGAPGGMSDAVVGAILAGGDGRVWAAVEYAGVEVFDPAVGRVAALRPDPARPDTALPTRDIVALVPDPDGGVWAGSLDGLYRIDAQAAAVARVPLALPDPSPEAPTLQVLGRDLWIGAPRGLVRHDRGTGADRLYPLDPANPARSGGINAILPRPDGRLWVGSAEGLFLVSPDGAPPERMLPDRRAPGSLSHRFVTALAWDRSGRLWVGTDGGGIDLLEQDGGPGQGRFRHLGAAAGLPDDHVDALLADADGRMWVSTDGGLAVVDPVSLAIHALRREDGVRITAYSIGAADRTPAGDLLFGGRGGVTVVRPDRPSPAAPAAPLVLTGIRVGGSAEPAGRHVGPDAAPIVVPPAARSVEVEFAALDYAAPEHASYGYRLDGVDADWIATDPGHRRAAYAGLAPGDYQLLLRGANRDGLWGEPLRVAIRVLPAWYQRLWFRAAEALAAMLGVMAVVRARTTLLRRRQRELERQVAAQTAELAAAHAAAVAGEVDARRARDAAETATRAKSRFMAVVSHEVRAPLNGILGMLQMLAALPLDPSQRRYLSIAEESGRTLRSLIDGILDFERLQAQGETLDMRPFDLAGLLTGVVEQLQAPAAAKGIALTLDLPPDLPGTVCSDPARLGRVLLNLAGNAIKFTQRGGVRLTARVEGSAPAQLTVMVVDTGIGIATDKLEAIFEEFVQADDSIAARFGGTGLGLAICRRIAELMGGSLTVDSIIGVGSTFRLAVPVTLADVPAVPASAPPAGPQAALSVLVIDDDAVNRAVAEGLLGTLGHRAALADDAEAGIAAAATGRFDAVLMDLHMPGLDGLAAARRIRALEGGGALRLLAMTADATSDSARRARAAGFDGLLTKPLDLAVLSQALAAAPARDDGVPILDVDFLSHQRDALSMRQLITIVRLFHRMSRQTLAAMAASPDDRALLSALAHRLRGAASSLGLQRLNQAAAALEAGAATASDDDLATMIAAVRDLRQASLSALLAAARQPQTSDAGPMRPAVSR